MLRTVAQCTCCHFARAGNAMKFDPLRCQRSCNISLIKPTGDVSQLVVWPLVQRLDNWGGGIFSKNNRFQKKLITLNMHEYMNMPSPPNYRARYGCIKKVEESACIILYSLYKQQLTQNQCNRFQNKFRSISEPLITEQNSLMLHIRGVVPPFR